MIIGIGTDVVEHQVTKDLNWDTDQSTVTRYFSKSELKLYKVSEHIKVLAGKFAAKEAVLKSLGTGMEDGISLKQIEILHEKTGKPQIKLSKNVKKLAKKMGVKKWHLSISHSTTFSIAVAIAEGSKG